MPETVLIASDHAGFDLKAAIIAAIPGKKWNDLGPSSKERVDYPDFAEKLCKAAVAGGSRGILICGTGIGMSIAANKFAGIRAASAENPVSARLSREHNDANVLCLAARILAPEYAAEIARIWLETAFSGEPRHAARIRKISAFDQ